MHPTWHRILRHSTLTLLLTAGVLNIAGCGVTSSQLTSAPAASPSGPLQFSAPASPVVQSVEGQVHGGAQTVTGARIYLYAAGTSGYGGASVSLLSPTFSGVITDSSGSYVLTDGNGNFSLRGAYRCTPGQQTYLFARGGNPGLPGFVDNPALALMSPLGACPTSGSIATTVPVVNINEVSTIAAIYALSGFMTDPTHVSAPSNALAQQGLANAFLAATNIVDLGVGTAKFLTIAYNGVAPQATVNTLANMLAACVNTTGVTTPCSTLFSNTKNSSGVLPSDTVTAALNIAHNPGANVAPLFTLAGTTLPFAPTLAVAPNDWTVAITFYSDTMAGPYYPAIDAAGNVWVPAYANNTLAEYDPLGNPLSGFSGYAGNSLNQPLFVAIDSAQTAWVANFAYGTNAMVSRFTPNGSAFGATACGTNCTAVAIDSLQNVWIAANSGTTAIHNSGAALGTFSTTSMNTGLAIDSTGRGWSIGKTRNLYHLTLTSTVTQLPEAITSTLPNDLNMFAIDSSDHIWFSSGKNNVIGCVDSSGNLISPASGYTGGGLKYPAQLAIDGSNRVWVANRDGNSISAFTNSGTAISPATGYQPSGQVAPDATLLGLTGLQTPHGLAIDGSGNVWVTNFTSNSVTEFLGLATPVVTPISPTTHGQRP